MRRYLFAVLGGISLSFVFILLIPFALLGEGAIETQLSAAAVLGLAALGPGLFVGWVILQRWPESLVVMVVTGLSVFVAHIADVFQTPMGQPEYWPIFVAPLVATLVSAVIATLQRLSGSGQPT